MKSRFLFIGLLVLVYFLPLLLSFFRRRRDLKRVLFLNLALGWTVIGWFWLLFHSSASVSRSVSFLRDLDRIESRHAKELLERLAHLRGIKECQLNADRLGENLSRAALCMAAIKTILSSKLDSGEFTAERFTSTCESAFKQLLLRVQHLSNQLTVPCSQIAVDGLNIEQELLEVEQLVESLAKFGRMLSMIDVENGTPLQPVQEIIRELNDISDKAGRLRNESGA